MIINSFSGENLQDDAVSARNYIHTELFRHNIIQWLIVLGNIVDVAVVADGFEMTTGTFYLAFF